jgi:hypothetical protein
MIFEVWISPSGKYFYVPRDGRCREACGKRLPYIIRATKVSS